MFSSSARGQTEPIAALLAVVVVAAGLALYADVLDDALDRTPDSNVASASLERVETHLGTGGVVDPRRLDSVDAVTAEGYETNVSLVVAERRWTAGSPPADGANSATRTVSVRVEPAAIERGQLRVVTWS